MAPYALLAIRQLAVPLSLAAILNLSFNTDLTEQISNISLPTGAKRIGAALLSVAGACCSYALWRQRREWAEIDRLGRAVKRVKDTRIRQVAPDVESLPVKQRRLQAALSEAQEDAGRVRKYDAPPTLTVHTRHTDDIHVRMGRSTDAADVTLVADIVTMINTSYRHGYADILVSKPNNEAQDFDEISEQGEGSTFSRTSFAEILWRLQMCSDPGSARKLLLAFDERRICLGCCSVTAPYGDQRLGGEWGLVCVSRHAQGRGIASRLVAAAEAHCVLCGCNVIQLEYFVAEGHEYSTRLRNWYFDKLGYQSVQRRACGNQLRGYATSVPMYFEIGHKRVSLQTVDTVAQRRLNMLALTAEVADRRAELCKLNELANLPTRTLNDLSADVVVRIILPLCGPRELRALEMTCTYLRDALQNAPKDMAMIWRQICHSTTDGNAPMLCYHAAELLAPAESFGLSHSLSGIDWKLVYRLRHVLPFSIQCIVDVGRGYTRYGLTQSGPEILATHVLGAQEVVEEDSMLQPPAPSTLQLCSSPSHPADASSGTQFSELLRRIVSEYRRLTTLKAIAAGPLGTAAAVQGWQWPGIPCLEHIVREIPLLVGEPFWLLKRHPGRGRSEAEERGNLQALDEWRVQIEQQCVGSCCVRFVPQPFMAMVAHGMPGDCDALVLNLGLRECIACAIVDGVVVGCSVQDTPIGGSTLTMLFLQQLAANPANASWLRNDDMTWCRDMKEEYCFVQLPGKETPAPVEVARPRAESLAHRTCLLDSERWLVPEALFTPTRFGIDARSITAILIAAATAAAGAFPKHTGHVQPGIFERLLTSIVVVGGASGLPNLRRRIEIDVSGAVKATSGAHSCVQTARRETQENQCSPRHDRLTARVRLPVVAGTGRVASDTIFQGGCVLASSALGIERSLGSNGQAPEEATYKPVDRDPAAWLSRVKMSQLFREQCLHAIADARAGQTPLQSGSA